MKVKTQNAKGKTTTLPLQELNLCEAESRSKIKMISGENLKLLNFNFRFCLFIFYFLLFLGGCATIKEAAKGIAGISTKAVEEARKNAISKQFNYDYKTCFNKAEGILKEKGSYIYAKDEKKQMFAVYVSKDDTTTVGVFFKEIDANNTQVEVSSLSTYARELIAKELFSGLEKGQPDAKKET